MGLFRRCVGLANLNWKDISRFRLKSKEHGLTMRDKSEIVKFVTDSPKIEAFSEKQLSLTLSLILDHVQLDQGSLAIESLVKRIHCMGFSLQGCNQFLGSLAKSCENGKSVPPEMVSMAQTVVEVFVKNFASTCGNREWTNVLWATSVLGLIEEGAKKIIKSKPLPDALKSMDCVDLSLLCAALVDRSKLHPILWDDLRAEILTRNTFTSKDIPSMLCSIACAGLGDRELVLHVSSVIQRENLLNARNVAAILWSVATCDFVHFKLIEDAVRLIINVAESPDSRGAELQQKGHRFDQMDVRRISRALSVSGKLGLLEKWIVTEAVSTSSTGLAKTVKQHSAAKYSVESVADSVLVWEFVTNGLYDSALKVFLAKPVSHWRDMVSKCDNAASQLFHLYIASLLSDEIRVQLSTEEMELLKSLRDKFAQPTEDISSSTLHKQASAALKSIKVSHVSEFKDPKTGYIIDMYLPEFNVGIEVQGPSHFITDIETGASILRPADRFKHAVLKNVSNMDVVQVTPWNFGPKIHTDNNVLMRRLLENSLKKGGKNVQFPKERRPPPPFKHTNKK